MMIRCMKWLLLAMLTLAVLCVVASVVLATLGSGAGPFGTARIQINGDEFSLAQWHAGHGLAGMAGLALALLIAAVVLPVALLVPLFEALLFLALALVVVLAVLAGLAALLFSPLLAAGAVAWLVWRALRTARRVDVAR